MLKEQQLRYQSYEYLDKIQRNVFFLFVKKRVQGINSIIKLGP